MFYHWQLSVDTLLLLRSLYPSHVINIIVLNTSLTNIEYHSRRFLTFASATKYDVRNSWEKGLNILFTPSILIIFIPFWSPEPPSATIFFLFKQFLLAIFLGHIGLPWHPVSIASWQIDGEKVETVTDFIFLGSKITADGDYSHEIKRRLLLGRRAMTKLDRDLKSRDITLLTKVCLVKAMVFPAVMYGCESWIIKKAEKIDAFELWCWRRLESPLNCKEIKPVHPKGNQPWILIGGTDTEAEVQILWPPDVNSWPTGKDPDAGKDWGQEEKEVTEDEMVGWHHWLNGHEFEQTPRDNRGQGRLVCCTLWGHRFRHSLVSEQQQGHNC